MTYPNVKIGVDPGGVRGDPGGPGSYLEVALEKYYNFYFGSNLIS